MEPSISSPAVLGELLCLAQRRQSVALKPVFDDLGLTFAQWLVMACLHSGQSDTASGIARKLAHDGGAMTRLIDKLEVRGCLRRVGRKDDRRLMRLLLTPKGVSLTVQCWDRISEQWHGWLSDWSIVETEAALHFLGRLYGCLPEFDTDTPPKASLPSNRT